MVMNIIEGLRYIILPSSHACIHCLQDQVQATDQFMFHTGSQLKRVANFQNPFLHTIIKEAAICKFSDGISINRSNLHMLPSYSICRHRSHATKQSVVNGGSYRIKELKLFFRYLKEEYFVSPVHAVIGTSINYDLSGVSTAKSSGFFIRYKGQNFFTQPWGGHTNNFADATRLGILEGIERAAGEYAAVATISCKRPTEVEVIDLDGFGIDIGPWRLESPIVQAWTFGNKLRASNQDIIGERVALPERLVFYNARIDTTPWVQDSSNGCAIGGSDSEAILFGLLEVIERDAFLNAWYGHLELHPIDQKTITDKESQAYIKRLRLVGADVVFLQATIDTQVPVIIAVCEEPGGSTCVGAGCHPDPERALKSALIEVASDFQVVALHREQRYEELARMLIDHSLVRSMEDHADMFAHPDARPLISHWRHPRNKIVSLQSLSIEKRDTKTSVDQDLVFCIRQCQKAGFTPIACNLSEGLANAIGACVWKVVVPGLIPIDFGTYQRVYSMSRLEYIAHRYGGNQLAIPFSPATTPHPFP